ncbi:hypothetical protein [Marinactinospora rubrisoli]|uniref:Uncharacterized protein n=1 Tax=Marinactinospora rubrisoli TaxID=2715399 RepID=A0ABW2KFB3_9ACTN
MTTKRHSDSGWQGVRWVLGTVLIIQGFGSAVTEAVWDTSFGVAGLLRGAGLPQWTDLLVGAAGAALLVWALAHRASGRTHA